MNSPYWNPQEIKQTIRKAVIPAAGLGSRMRSITGGAPKEMLLVGAKPMLQYVVEEAVAAGIKQVCIVIRKGKEVIRDYFCLKSSAGTTDENMDNKLEALIASCEFTFVYQESQLGLGDALLQAQDFVGTDSFVMMIPDQLMFGPTPAALQLRRRWRTGPAIWSSLLRLPKEERPFFVGARGVEYHETEPGEVAISRHLTEEETRRVHSNLSYEVRGFGRTIFPPQIFDYLGAEFADQRTGEVDLLRTFEKCSQELEVFGIWLEGEPFDLGTPESYYRYRSKILELEQAALQARQA